MKYFVLFALFASAFAVPTCDDCKAAADTLKTYLTGDESMAEQIAILTATVCPAAEDPAECETLLNTYYPEMAGVLFAHFLQADTACGMLGYCFKEVVPRDWTCDECLDTISRLGVFMSEDATIAEGIALLQGDAYCTDGHEHTEDCAGLVEMFIPVAMPVLAAALQEKAQDLCTNLLPVC